jgi:tRNA (guanosine-2'-O-)-methyltransferase
VVLRRPLPLWHRSPVADALDQLIVRHGAARVHAVLAPMVSPDRLARIDQVLAARLGSLTVITEDTYDPHNAAAAVRTAEALGLCEFHAVEPTYHFSLPKGITRGCHRWLELHRWGDAAACTAALRARGFVVMATLPAAAATLDTLAVDRPVALMFGNEHAGLSPAAIAACDGAVTIPMYGFTESFNLSVSVALAISKLADRRRAHLGRPGDLEPDQVAHLRARWAALRIKGVIGVVERLLAEAR